MDGALIAFPQIQGSGGGEVKWGGVQWGEVGWGGTFELLGHNEPSSLAS